MENNTQPHVSPGVASKIQESGTQYAYYVKLGDDLILALSNKTPENVQSSESILGEEVLGYFKVVDNEVILPYIENPRAIK